MTNIEIFTDEQGIEHVKIERGNGEFTWMEKSTYDELIANEAKTK
jgi:hypothetical protein